MRAIVNIGFREVTIEYSIDKKLQNAVAVENRQHNWEMTQKSDSSRKIQCKQSFFFEDSDEWKTIQLLDGRIIDFHYDYENRSEFDSKKEWASYLFQGYAYAEEDKQNYDEPVVESVKVIV